MNIQRIQTIAQIGVVVLSLVAGGSALNSHIEVAKLQATQPCQAANINCNCNHPPLRGDFIWPKK